MVLFYSPQHFKSSIQTNTNYPPQSFLLEAGVGPPPSGDNELIEETGGIFSNLLYDQNGGAPDGFVIINEGSFEMLYEDTDDMKYEDDTTFMEYEG